MCRRDLWGITGSSLDDRRSWTGKGFLGWGVPGVLLGDRLARIGIAGTGGVLCWGLGLGSLGALWFLGLRFLRPLRASCSRLLARVIAQSMISGSTVI